MNLKKVAAVVVIFGLALCSCAGVPEDALRDDNKPKVLDKDFKIDEKLREAHTGERQELERNSGGGGNEALVKCFKILGLKESCSESDFKQVKNEILKKECLGEELAEEGCSKKLECLNTIRKSKQWN